MTGWRRRAALWIVGAALAAASTTAIALSPTVNHGFIAFALIIGGSFIATGLVALARRPENRFGLLLYAVGVAWFVGTLTTSGNAYVYSIGALFSTTYYAVLVHAILAYPRGRLESRPAKVIVLAAYADTLGIQLLVSLVEIRTTSRATPTRRETCSWSRITPRWRRQRRTSRRRSASCSWRPSSRS